MPIVAVNPLRERGLQRFQDPQSKLEMATLGATPISTHYFQLRVGGDLAAVKGMMKHVLEQEAARGGVLDRAFIAERRDSGGNRRRARRRDMDTRHDQRHGRACGQRGYL